MNRERHAYWSAYIADLQKRMLLTNWNIDLSVKEPDNPSAHAAIAVLPGRHEARVYLHKDFDSCTRAEQRHYIVHELVHAHLASLWFHLEMQVGDEGRQITTSHITHEEYAVDDLARIIAPSMPLPPKVKL